MHGGARLSRSLTGRHHREFGEFSKFKKWISPKNCVTQYRNHNFFLYFFSRGSLEGIPEKATKSQSLGKRQDSRQPNTTTFSKNDKFVKVEVHTFSKSALDVIRNVVIDHDTEALSISFVN